MLKRDHSNTRGSALVIVTLLIMLALGGAIMFMSRSANFLNSVMNQFDGTTAQFQLEGALESAREKLDRAMEQVALQGKLRFVNSNATLASTGERFDVLNNLYATDQNANGSALDEASLFLEHMIRSTAYNPAGTLSPTHEFASFASAFPTTWTDPDETDDDYYQIQYAFYPLRVESEITSTPRRILFEYEYVISIRSYGKSRFAVRSAEDSGVISIEVRGAPFSRWALFAHSLVSQTGGTLYFAGGNTSAQAQEVYGGPVHVNQRPNFYGHPRFKGLFTSATPESQWLYTSAPNYTGCPAQCPVFEQGKIGGYSSITMPSTIFNTHRLAAGDTSQTASTNNTAPTVTEMKNFLKFHSGGTLNQTLTSIPNGIYVPVNNLTDKLLTGGIYVQGDAEIQMNVLQGQADFPAAAWSQMAESHRSCKFQRLRIVATQASNQTQDILVGDEPCNVTYVFNGSNYSTAPSVLNGRINGNIHVNGAIGKLGGQSRTRPAVAADFALTISAVKDVNIVNDIQYEDAEYVTADASGNVGSDAVANAYGSLNGSSISPTDPNVSARISSDSQTILGIMSTQRNVYIFTSAPYNAATSAPDNINLHAAIYAGNANAFNSSTGLGCGSNTEARRGCGFGVLNYSTAPNKGNIKFFGGISEFKDQTTGLLSSSFRGYSSRYYYDQRLMNTINPPAFPVSDAPQAYGSIKKFKTLRMASH